MLNTNVMIFVLLVAGAPVPRAHGDSNVWLRTIAESGSSRLKLGDSWTYGDSAVIFIPYDEITSVADRDEAPWSPAWVNNIGLRNNKGEPAALGADLILVFRHYDATTCTVNKLSGDRIIKESAKEQDRTSEQIACNMVEKRLRNWGVAERWIGQIARRAESKIGTVTSPADGGNQRER